jgi:thiol-disulfide isomerase/thioredoxin
MSYLVAKYFTYVIGLLASFLSFSLLVQCQAVRKLPGCEAASEVRKTLDETLDAKALDKMKFAERITGERQVLEELIAEYPREIEPYQQLIKMLRSDAPDELPVLRDRLVKMAKDNPDDPLALTLAGVVLRHRDIAESIRLLEMAKMKAPTFPWPARELAADYFTGKHVDTNKVKENLELFFADCPASTDGLAHWLLAKDEALQQRVAMSLRRRLQNETDPKELRNYEVLWGLEFRTRALQEHDALRAQLSEDLKRLERLNPKGDSEWQAFLIKGYKQSGTARDFIEAKENLLIHDHPHSSEAFAIVRQRWEETHKQPKDGADTTAWDQYQKEYENALKVWIRDYPDVASLQRYDWFYAIEDDDAISEQDGIAALDLFLQAVKDFQPPNHRIWTYASAAQFLIQRGWQPERALELLQLAKQAGAKDHVRSIEDDNLSEKDVEGTRKEEMWQEQYLDGLILKAAKQSGRLNEATRLKPFIETVPPPEKKLESGYWFNRARLAALDNHIQDALAYYQLALQTRIVSPRSWHGKLRDDLTDEAHALWKAQGGTEGAWAIWSKPPSSEAALAEAHWEKATRAIPNFELSDLSGKTWRLKALAGKTVLIALWATWCGPCEAELPHLQMFYEKVKTRPDLQVLTFDLDEDLGLVAPYLKEKGYTFPVLPAYSTAVNLLDGFAIPQNWIVDRQGVWRWTQIGYGGGADEDFEQDMLARVESINRE